jgi:hypothetical protein
MHLNHLSYEFSGVYLNDLTKKKPSLLLSSNILPSILKHVTCLDCVNVYFHHR